MGIEHPGQVRVDDRHDGDGTAVDCGLGHQRPGQRADLGDEPETRNPESPTDQVRHRQAVWEDAGVFVLLSAFSLDREVALGAGLMVGLTVRGMALHRGWSLPRYRERRGRTPEEIKRLD